MLKSELLPFRKLKTGRTCIRAFCVLAALLTPAFGQDFTLTMSPFPPPAAIDPGGTASSNITLSVVGSFSNTVDLSCQVTQASSGQAVSSPVCQMSPESAAPPATATATITTSGTGATPPGLYTITVTGTASGTSNSHSAQQNLTVLAVTPDYTITVTQQVEPSTVHAGSGGQGTVSVNPLNGYTGNVTLSCATITPLVTAPPVCSFSYPSDGCSGTCLPVNGAPVTSTITITTIGPVPQSALAHAGQWYAFWLGLPMLGIVGVGVLSGKRSGRAMSVLALLVMAGSILLMPACATSPSTNNNTTNNTTNVITPKNAYTFTVTGVDANGVVSGNAGAGAPTVTLTVN
jgi:hypothetical protein